MFATLARTKPKIFYVPFRGLEMISKRSTLENDLMLLGKISRNTPAIIDAGVRIFAGTLLAHILFLYGARTITECEREIKRRLKT